ncbi:UDP binding domain-containing protein [Streptomyces sp. G45]|uniref:UDP binding domain-containing protein n=1 Tax=Streptomyces sp. G45 TaxID=3406627 RepID=UPI003C2589A1
MPLLDAAHRQVRQRPRRVVTRLADLLRAQGGDLAGSRVLVAGVTYKPGVPDTRNAPGLDIIRELRKRSAKPRYTDPYLTELVVDGEVVERADWVRESVTAHDCVILVTPHRELLDRPLWYAAPLVLDTWQTLPTGDGIHHL